MPSLIDLDAYPTATRVKYLREKSLSESLEAVGVYAIRDHRLNAREDVSITTWGHRGVFVANALGSYIDRVPGVHFAVNRKSPKRRFPPLVQYQNTHLCEEMVHLG